jgi:hypothetical protein
MGGSLGGEWFIGYSTSAFSLLLQNSIKISVSAKICKKVGDMP